MGATAKTGREGASAFPRATISYAGAIPRRYGFPAMTKTEWRETEAFIGRISTVSVASTRRGLSRITVAFLHRPRDRARHAPGHDRSVSRRQRRRQALEKIFGYAANPARGEWLGQRHDHDRRTTAVFERRGARVLRRRQF